MPIFSPTTTSTLLNHLSGSDTALRCFASHTCDIARSRVVAREREQRPIAFAEMRIGEILGHQNIRLLRAGMDIGLRDANVADFHFGSRGGHKLHNADGADVAARFLV